MGVHSEITKHEDIGGSKKGWQAQYDSNHVPRLVNQGSIVELPHLVRFANRGTGYGSPNTSDESWTAAVRRSESEALKR